MKYSFFLLLISGLIFFTACQNQGTVIHANQFSAADSANFTQVKWLDSVVNFDTIRMGDTVTVHFRLKTQAINPYSSAM